MPLGESVSEVGRGLRMPPPEVVTRLLAVWDEIVGPDVARHVDVRAVREGILVVEVDDPAWASQVRFLESDVCAAVVDRIGPGVVEAVRVVVRGADGPGR